MDVSALVSQMNETLSAIHSTLATLDTAPHVARLDALEQQRDTAVQALRAAFLSESDQLAAQRRAERVRLAEQRRREDEERERSRRAEDEEMGARERNMDEGRAGRLQAETRGVEEQTEGLMGEIEDAAARLLEAGKEKLRRLEEKRQVSGRCAGGRGAARRFRQGRRLG